MKSKFVIATLAAIAFTPAIAYAEASKTNEAFANHVSKIASAKQIQTLLLSKKYKNVSELHRDTNGRWIGTAEKDGVRQIVSVKLPVAAPNLN